MTTEAMHKVLSAFRRALRKFETDRTETRSTFEITIELTPDDLDGGWIASVVELPGCMSQGETEAEAMRNVVDAFSEVISHQMAKRLAKHESVDHGTGPHRHRETLQVPVAAH